MKVGRNKIYCELIEEKQEGKIFVAEEQKMPFVKGTILAVGNEIIDAKVGEEIIVFNVYPAQMLEYDGKKVFFVNANEAFYFIA